MFIHFTFTMHFDNENMEFGIYLFHPRKMEIHLVLTFLKSLLPLVFNIQQT
jgi:hypothetical protein